MREHKKEFYPTMQLKIMLSLVFMIIRQKFCLEKCFCASHNCRFNYSLGWMTASHASRSREDLEVIRRSAERWRVINFQFRAPWHLKRYSQLKFNAKWKNMQSELFLHDMQACKFLMHAQVFVALSFSVEWKIEESECKLTTAKKKFNECRAVKF